MQEMRNTTSAHRLTLSYDTRNIKETPTCGFLGSLYAETALNTLGSDASYDRLGLDLKGFQPWDADQRFVTAIRLTTELMTRQRNTPFYELPTLGGFETNRGYGEDRYIDRNMIAFSLEQRIRIFTMHHYGVDSHWEVAPFLDIGKVFPTPGRFNLAHLHTTGGISFRAVVRPTIVGHVDIGVGREGNAIFMGLGYPF
jgi:outer membrane protein assembly factor BamA